MWAPLVAAGVGIASGIEGNRQASKSAKEAQKIKDRAAQEIYGIDVPDVQDLQYQNDLQTYVGDQDPTLVSNLGDISSQYDQIKGDPRFQTAQYQSLGALDDIVNSGGLTASDKLANQQAQDDVSMQNSRAQGAITRDLAERGLGGSGMEMAQRLSANQTAANLNANAAQTQQATAQQRALDAIMQRGNLSGSMQAADYAQQNKAAEAKDLIAKFNQTNAYNVNQQNANTANTAQAANLQNRQAVSNANVGLNNATKAQNTGAIQQTFGNQLDKGNAAVGVANGQAASRTAQGEATKNMYGGIANAAATAGSAYADYDKANKPK